MAKCSSITANGDPCSRNAKMGINLCSLHEKCRIRHGPHTYERLQLTYQHKREMDNCHKEHQDLLNSVNIDDVEQKVEVINGINRVYAETISRLSYQQARELTWLDEHHADVVETIGFDPDAEAKARKEAEKEERRQRRQRLIQNRLRAHANWEVMELGQDNPPERGLGAIAADPQGVHTSEVVKNVKKIIANVRAIPVPDGYKWDKIVCSKTPGEIITECRLTQSAAWQMMSQYAQDTSIYDIEEGIYGKVLDCVWQFIKTHAEKESLVSILRTELEDNIGMCAQGNLTRICNILAGYLDGVGSLESLSDRLGRLLHPLTEIENRDERHTRVLDILTTNEVPPDQWDAWIDAVMA